MDIESLTSPPRKVYIEPTTECNIDCAMCIRQSWEQPGGTMSDETFTNILRQLNDLPTVRTINFSGYGEPTTHPLFYDFLARAKATGRATEFVTNGLRLDNQAIETILRLQVDRLIVSVDSVSTTGSERLHAGSFQAVSASLQKLYHGRLAGNLSKPDVCLVFVATRRNIDQLPQLKALAPVLGFSNILVTNLIPHSPDLIDDTLYKRWSTSARQNAEPSPYNPCVDLPIMDTHSPAGEVMQRLQDAGTHLRINGADVHGSPPRCPFIAQGRLAIRFDGSVSPCLPLLHTHTHYLRGRSKRVFCHHVGNVNHTPLADLWAQASYRNFRDRVREFRFSWCMDCRGCDLRMDNREDCTSDVEPRCGECPWAMGLVQCP